MAQSVIDFSRRLEISHEPWTVRRLASFYEPPSEEHPGGNGRLYLPRHQREWSWKHKRGLQKMRRFIDSILHNYPVHTIILNAHDDGVRERWEIYDGRHRVETLWRFVNNVFPLVIDGEEIYYKEKEGARCLTETDRARFNDRQIPVAVTGAATPSQLAEVFIRLNSGKPLSQADYCWACRDTPLIRGTMALLEEFREPFRELFGGYDITVRKNMPDWIGIMAGVLTGQAGNMTTSFERLQAHLDLELTPRAHAAMSALRTLYTVAAAAVAGTHARYLKEYRRVGFINAFFLADWMAASTPVEANEVAVKWVRVITHIRTTGSKALVRVSGAQNLNDRKIADIRERVRLWIAGGAVPAQEDGSEEFSDEEDD